MLLVQSIKKKKELLSQGFKGEEEFCLEWDRDHLSFVLHLANDLFSLRLSPGKENGAASLD